MKVLVYYDADGLPRAEVPPPCQVVGWFLEQDIQENAAYCRELLRLIDMTARGEEPSWEATGNAHTLTVRPRRARIENEYAIPGVSCDLALDDLRDVMTTWLELIEDKQANAGG